MSAADESTPRVFLYRHGETDWARSGRYTGLSDIPLNARGIRQVTSTAHLAIGPHRLIDPSKVGRVYASPRVRAQQTFELAFGSKIEETGGDKPVDGFKVLEGGELVAGLRKEGKVVSEERMIEWTYGEYEGLFTKEIKERRKAKGLDGEREWDIWRDGCDGGESPAQVTARLDSLIAEIKALQAPHMKAGTACDVVLFGHGHICRAFVKRWLGLDMGFSVGMMLEPGGVGILSYQHKNIEEPAVLVGIAFPNDETS